MSVSHTFIKITIRRYLLLCLEFVSFLLLSVFIICLRLNKDLFIMSTNIILGAKLGQSVTSTVCVEIWLKRLKILIRY